MKNYGVFILKNNQWVQHVIDTTEDEARREASYLVKSLGVTAKVFKRCNIS